MRTIEPRVIALHLPQFHPIAENDAWWGPGFTEWHNVARARPLFRGHVQPNLPGELGFYDLRLAQTRLDQALLARSHGIHGFCYWHYWFAGRRLLERPLEDILASREPDFPFCLGWANESWTGIWHGSPNSLLMEQTYPEGDPDAHYALLRRFFHDPRYIRHEGRPLLYIYKPLQLPPNGAYLRRLRALAEADGLPGLYVLGTWTPTPRTRFDSVDALGLDGAVITNITGRDTASPMHVVEAVMNRLRAPFGGRVGPKRIDYGVAARAMLPDLDRFAFPAYNTVIPNWDNTPRSARRGLVLTGASPVRFREVMRQACANLASVAPEQAPGDFIFLKSWNEWAEGNYVEPDQVVGRAWLEALQEALSPHLAID